MHITANLIHKHCKSIWAVELIGDFIFYKSAECVNFPTAKNSAFYNCNRYT